MIITPPYLRKGDTVGIVCPAGFMPKEKTDICRDTLERWGLKVLFGKTVGHQHHYFSATDEVRLQDLQSMLENPDIKAILCARGGYGTSRIIDQVNWKRFKKKPKWIIGYSDVTVLNCHLYAKLKTASMHAPMAGAFYDAGGEDEFNGTLKKGLFGKKIICQSPAHPFNKSGKATGILIGGNLSILAHLVGTDSMPDTKGCILFMEDVGEYLYNIDRMLLQLERAGKLQHLAAIIVGGFTESRDTTIPFGKTAYELIYERVNKYAIPIAYDFPVSHSRENISLRVGLPYTLVVGKHGSKLTGNP